GVAAAVRAEELRVVVQRLPAGAVSRGEYRGGGRGLHLVLPRVPRWRTLRQRQPEGAGGCPRDPALAEPPAAAPGLSAAALPAIGLVGSALRSEAGGGDRHRDRATARLRAHRLPVRVGRILH